MMGLPVTIGIFHTRASYIVHKRPMENYLHMLTLSQGSVMDMDADAKRSHKLDRVRTGSARDRRRLDGKSRPSSRRSSGPWKRQKKFLRKCRVAPPNGESPNQPGAAYWIVGSRLKAGAGAEMWARKTGLPLFIIADDGSAGHASVSEIYR